MAGVDLNATLVYREDLAPGLGIFRIKPDSGVLADFKPGQYTTIGLPPDALRVPNSPPEEIKKPDAKFIRRAYSIASPPTEKNYIELFIVMVPEGPLTSRLFNLKVGDKLWLTPKITGAFTMDDAPEEANIVFMGTGTGLAPYMSMLRTRKPRQGGPKMALLHGVRQSWDLGYLDELHGLEKEFKNFAFIPTVSRPQNEKTPWTGHVGYVQHVWGKKMVDAAWGLTPTPRDTHIFLCGSPGMIDSVMALLTQQGFTEYTKNTPGNVHIERYW